MLRLIRDAILRSSVLTVVLTTLLLATHAESTFKALATRGDWFLGQSESPTARSVRSFLFDAADGLEWLYNLVREKAFADEDLLDPDILPDGDIAPEVAGDPSVLVAPAPNGVKPQEKRKRSRTRYAELPIAGWDRTWPLPNKVHPKLASMPSSAKGSVDAVAAWVTSTETDPYLRVKLIHDFVATHVAYDVASLRDGSFAKPSTQSPKTVLERGMGVCAGYARLMAAIGKVTGDHLRYVHGDTRTEDMYATHYSGDLPPRQDVGHAWVMARIRRNMTKRSAFAAPLVKASGIVEMYRPSGSGRSARLAPH